MKPRPLHSLKLTAVGAFQRTAVWPMKRLAALLAVVAMMVCVAGCHSIDDDRIPPALVYIPFQTSADWNVYGVSGACQHKRFIKSERVPSGYPWVVSAESGFGGVLLATDVHGTPVAYDLACPVEARADVRIVVDTELLQARCPKCGSRYEIFTNFGYPVAGIAAERGYGLRRYRVGPGASGQYMIITR